MLGVAAVALLLFTRAAWTRWSDVCNQRIHHILALPVGDVPLCWANEAPAGVGTTDFVHVVGLVMCVGILAFTVVLKFAKVLGLTMLVTAGLVGVLLGCEKRTTGGGAAVVPARSDLSGLPGWEAPAAEPDPGSHRGFLGG